MSSVSFCWVTVQCCQAHQFLISSSRGSSFDNVPLMPDSAWLWRRWLINRSCHPLFWSISPFTTPKVAKSTADSHSVISSGQISDTQVRVAFSCLVFHVLFFWELTFASAGGRIDVICIHFSIRTTYTHCSLASRYSTGNTTRWRGQAALAATHRLSILGWRWLSQIYSNQYGI